MQLLSQFYHFILFTIQSHPQCLLPTRRFVLRLVHFLPQLLNFPALPIQSLLQLSHVLFSLIQLKFGLAKRQEHQSCLLCLRASHILKHDLTLFLHKWLHLSRGVEDADPFTQLGNLVGVSWHKILRCLYLIVDSIKLVLVCLQQAYSEKFLVSLEWVDHLL